MRLEKHPTYRRLHKIQLILQLVIAIGFYLLTSQAGRIGSNTVNSHLSLIRLPLIFLFALILHGGAHGAVVHYLSSFVGLPLKIFSLNVAGLFYGVPIPATVQFVL